MKPESNARSIEVAEGASNAGICSTLGLCMEGSTNRKMLLPHLD